MTPDLKNIASRVNSEIKDVIIYAQPKKDPYKRFFSPITGCLITCETKDDYIEYLENTDFRVLHA